MQFSYKTQSNRLLCLLLFFNSAIFSLELDCYMCGTRSNNYNSLESKSSSEVVNGHHHNGDFESPESCSSFEKDFSWSYHSVTCSDDHLCVKIVTKSSRKNPSKSRATYISPETEYESHLSNNYGNSNGAVDGEADNDDDSQMEVIQRGCSPIVDRMGYSHRIGCGYAHEEEQVQVCFCNQHFCNFATKVENSWTNRLLLFTTTIALLLQW